MADYVCLLFDADGIVRATDTIVADDIPAASENAHALLSLSAALAYFELWYDQERVLQTPGKHTGASRRLYFQTQR